MASSFNLSVVRDKFAGAKTNAGNDPTGVLVQNQYSPAVQKSFQAAYISNIESLTPSNTVFRYADPSYNGADQVIVTETQQVIQNRITG